MSKSKTCTKCDIEKPLSEFHKHKTGKFGVRSECKKCVNKYHKEYRDNNKHKILKKCKEYRDNNKEKINLWHKDNKEKINKYNKNRRKTDIGFKIKGNLRRRLNLALNGKDKTLSTMFLIGCEIDYLMYHIQEQFTEGMNWDNYGYYGWHIDHKTPCDSFDLSKPEEQQECFNYTNLQPLWAKKNMRKGSKLIFSL